VCYLAQTSDGRNILIDSGIPDPQSLPADMPELTIYPTVVEQLALIGLQPQDIDLLICTHFDMDHAGQHAAFQHAPFVVQRSHYEVARHEPRYARTRGQWDLPNVEYRLLDGDTELLPGLELIETSGHVPGHQSVLVRLAVTGPVLLTIDAVPDQQSFTPERQAGPRDVDVEGTRASTQKLLDLAERERVALSSSATMGSSGRRSRNSPTTTADWIRANPGEASAPGRMDRSTLWLYSTTIIVVFYNEVVWRR
jgi:N-acyl homoserine lactone hydrolase